MADGHLTSANPATQYALTLAAIFQELTISNKTEQSRMRSDLRPLLLTLLLFSCEPFYGSEIRNDSMKPIQIIVEFDEQTLDDAWGDGYYIPFLKQYALDSGVSIVTFDSINLVTKYEVLPGVRFDVEHGQGVKPDYELFKRITIISDDTTYFNDKKEIDAAFELVGKWRWRLRVR